MCPCLSDSKIENRTLNERLNAAISREERELVNEAYLKMNMFVQVLLVLLYVQ